MANIVAIPRFYLVYGVCLPLAILVGYQLAEPMESSSVGILVLVLSILSIPFLLRWHHPLLVLCWNCSCVLYFLPGAPGVWMFAAWISLFLAMLDRSVGRRIGFFNARQVAASLVCFTAIVMATAYLTGGVGLRTMGSETFGGRKYVFLLSGVAGYFALATQRITPNRAGIYVLLFFLSGLASLLGLVGAMVPGLEFLAQLFPTPYHLTGEMPNSVINIEPEITRLGVLMPVSLGLFTYLLARYGVRGVTNIRRPWRLLLLGVAVMIGAFAGFRSLLITLFATFALLFYWEGLFRMRYLFIAVLAGGLCLAFVAPFAQKLPMPVQRTLSFLPIDVDPFARADAEGSTDWRLDMWKQLLPEVPRHLIKGKGYGIDPTELYMANVSSINHGGEQSAIVAGDYHNGPLSVIIPFGAFGAAAFLWFLWACIRTLHQNYRHGDPSLRLINTLLLALFVTRAIMFFVVFGSLFSDMSMFTGLIGLSVSLNSGVAQPQTTEEEVALDDPAFQEA